MQALLPPRAQARADSLDGRSAIVDALDLGATADGARAFVTLVGVSGGSEDRELVVPGVVRDGVFVRDADVASLLQAGEFGAFSVSLFGGDIPVGPVQHIDVDQSNDSVVMGEVGGHARKAVMVKWQLDAVPSPAPARLLALADAHVTPPVRGLVLWRDSDGEQRMLMSAAEYLPGARDGWTWAVELVRAHALGSAVDAIEPFAMLGEMTARMHCALAAAGVDSWTRRDLARLHGECRADLEAAVRLIDGDEGARLRARADAIGVGMDALAEIDSTPVIDVHGDFHIGQVLQTRDDVGAQYAFVDFDGNPVLSPTERMVRQPAARDVAGMLASIDHVARVVNYRTEGLDPRPAVIWIPHAQDAFLAAYQSALFAAGHRALLDDRLLRPLMLDQECREFVYSATHLPHWRYVPDAVLTDMFPDEGDR